MRDAIFTLGVSLACGAVWACVFYLLKAPAWATWTVGVGVFLAALYAMSAAHAANERSEE